jgi:hypothetical protein
MPKAQRMTATAAVIGIAALSLSTPALAGSSDVTALVGFGIRAILGGIYGPIPRTQRAYGDRAYPRIKTPPRAVVHQRRPGPARPKTAKTEAPTGAIAPTRAKTPASPPAPRVAQKTDVKFEAAQAKAKRDGVHTLTQKDIEGLSVAQLKEIRGY